MRSVLLRLQLYWWVFTMTTVPFALPYVIREPFAVTYLGVFTLVMLAITTVNLLLKNLKLTPISSKSFVTVLLLFVLAMLFGALNSDPISNSYGLLVSRMFLPIVFGYITYLMLKNDLLTAEILTGTLLLSLVALIASGAAQYFGLVSYKTPNRVSGPYVGANTFARYIEVVLLLTISWLLYRKNYKLLPVWFLGVLALLLSVSYNGVATFFIGLITLIVVLPRAVLSGRVKLLIISIFAVVFVGIFTNLQSLPKYQVSINDSRNSRLEYWHIAWHVIKENPIKGIGIKTWEQNYPQYVIKYGKQPPINWSSPQPHDVFLDAWLKAGLLGLVSICLLLLWPIIYAAKHFHNHQNQWVIFGVFVSGLALLLFGIIDDPIFHDDIITLVIVIDLALVAAVSGKNNGQNVGKN